jgi:hypothetical protein
MGTEETILTPWRGFLFEKLMVAYLAKTFI